MYVWWYLPTYYYCKARMPEAVTENLVSVVLGSAGRVVVQARHCATA